MRLTVAMTVVWLAFGSMIQGQPACAEDAVSDEMQCIFNGKDLSNWVDVTVNEDTFSVRDGVIYCTGRPTGVMRTDRHYENFILEVEWRHLRPKGNAGIFVWSDAKPVTHPRFTRSIEVQVLDGRETPNYTSHGDVFAIHGATMKPDRPHPAIRTGFLRRLFNRNP